MTKKRGKKGKAPDEGTPATSQQEAGAQPTSQPSQALLQQFAQMTLAPARAQSAAAAAPAWGPAPVAAAAPPVWGPPKPSSAASTEAQSGNAQASAAAAAAWGPAPAAPAWGQQRPSSAAPPSAQSQPKQSTATPASAQSQPKKKGQKKQTSATEAQSGNIVVSGRQEPQRSTSVKSLSLPNRLGEGTSGRPIKLSANHFAVKLANQSLYHYDIDIKPEPAPTLFRKIVFQFLKKVTLFRDFLPVYDGKKNIYTARQVEGLHSPRVFNHEFEEPEKEKSRELKFQITIQPTGTVEVDLEALLAYCEGRNSSSTNQPLRAIQALDIAIKYGALDRKVSIGHNLVSKQVGRPVDLGQGLEVWFGHFQSLRLGWKPFLNVDATQAIFMKSGKVHEIMAGMYGARTGEPLRFDWQYTEFAKKITALKISYSRGSYMASVGCNGLKGPANKETFDCDGAKVTVQQYFESKYNISLQYPNLPCVWVGSREKKNLVPMEICFIAEGQEYRRKLSDIQTSNLIKVAATPADVRKRKILDAVKDMKFATDAHCRNFGISVDSNMVQITGRVLPTPKLVYGGTGTMVPKLGVWNMRNMKFFDARSMDFFGFINITRMVNDNDINLFVRELSKSGQEMGMGIGNNLFIKHCGDRQLEVEMRNAKKTFPKLQIIFVIISRKGDPAYETVKRVGDLELLLTTQCIQFKNIKGKPGYSGQAPTGPDPSTVANICLKLNAKLGGVNNLIDRSVRPRMLLNEQVIIMGADVTHPGADRQELGKPSIAAVVGSVDPRASQYCTEIRIQASKQEFIEDMEGMVYNILRKFNRANYSTSTGKPQRIIFFRDGVSEGQFAKIITHELTAIRKACARLSPEYRPPITFVVVQKRHHTRLFPENPADEIGRGKNVPPGTVVDRTIVHPTESDFFLVSHQGIQGTSRPTHYHLLWDDSKMSSDELQTLTYYLCYLFTRCTRSVSYPAPCYYSHLVAFRGRQYYDELLRSKGRVSSADLQKYIDASRGLDFMFFV